MSAFDIHLLEEEMYAPAAAISPLEKDNPALTAPPVCELHRKDSDVHSKDQWLDGI
jgi:hypothetical protein